MADYLNNENFEEENDSGLNLKTIWMMLVLHWYWFCLSVIVCVAVAFFYLRYKQPVYSSAVKVLIKDDNGKSRPGQGTMDLTQIGVFSNSNGFDNELEILGSKNLATRTVKTLKLYVSYKMEGRVRDQELYKTSPILVDLEEARLDGLATPIRMKIMPAGQGIRVVGEMAEVDAGENEVISFEQTLNTLPGTIRTKAGLLLFQRNPGFELGERDLLVTLYPPRAMGQAYANSLSAEATSKTTTVARLTLVNTSIPRSLDYLAELINSYNIDANEDKNEVARKTEAFINERLEVIQSDLDKTEGELEDFKKDNELINLKNDATEALTNSSQYQQRQVEMQTQLTLVKSLLDYVQNSQNILEVIPANLGLSDAGLNTQIAEYNNTLLRRNRLLSSSSENSPAVVTLTTTLEGMWGAVLQSLQAVYEDLQTQKKSVDEQYKRFMGKVANTPGQERTLNNIIRQQDIKAGLYLMLLQKREENSISLASTAAKGRVIDAPEFLGKVSPKSGMIMAGGLVVGVGIPFAILLLLNFLRYKIEGREDVERLTKIPVLVDIPLAKDLDKGSRAVVVRANSNDMMEEAFRGLRTNLRFVLGRDEKVIICTSVIPGEGKTFVATNLAMSLALLGKKVLVVGLDIRKPRLVRLFGLKEDKRGITSYLANDTDDLDLLKAQITHGVLNENLDVLPAGVCPPNPGELISKDLLDKAISHFRDMYDYVIIDTPPVGLVSDTLEMGRVGDVTFFMCRADHSPKSNFEMINRISADGKMPKVNLVLNGVDLSKKKYGYYYGYGKYGRYGKYGHYGHYGVYGRYGSEEGSEIER